MCGRISQNKEPYEYFPESKPRMTDLFRFDRPNLTYNVPPGSAPMVLHCLEGDMQLTRWHWQYVPPWATKGKVAANARLDKIMDGARWWAGPLKHGRMIVPADGWYEWTGEKGDKQPWFIRPRDEKPLWMAAISGWRPGLTWEESEKTTGFAIVTDDSAGGMVDVHDRRPVILTLDAAMEWMDSERTPDQAREILTTARPESAFEWYQVTRKVGNAKYQGADSSEPIE